MVNMPRKERWPKKLSLSRPIEDTSYEARRTLASVEKPLLKPPHISIKEQIKRHEASGEHQLANILRNREAERKRKQAPTEQIPLDMGTGKKPEAEPVITEAMKSDVAKHEEELIKGIPEDDL